MIADEALANFCISQEMRRGGDTGKERVERRSFSRVHSHLKWLEPSGQRIHWNRSKSRGQRFIIRGRKLEKVSQIHIIDGDNPINIYHRVSAFTSLGGMRK